MFPRRSVFNDKVFEGSNVSKKRVLKASVLRRMCLKGKVFYGRVVLMKKTF